MHHSFALLLLTAALLVSCQGGPQPGSPPHSDPQSDPDAATGSPSGAREAPATLATSASETIWEGLGQWTGKQSVQTESFTGLTGAFRIKWEAKGPADGTFLLTIHSSISGRPLSVAVEQKGPGADTAYVNEDPRVFFAVIESDRMEWSFSVEEAMGTRTVTRAK